jgi:hypothetical protein
MANCTEVNTPSAAPQPNLPGERVAVAVQLFNRVFDGFNAIVKACCKAWNVFLGEVGRIASIAIRTWAIIGQ